MSLIILKRMVSYILYVRCTCVHIVFCLFLCIRMYENETDIKPIYVFQTDGARTETLGDLEFSCSDGN